MNKNESIQQVYQRETRILIYYLCVLAGCVMCLIAGLIALYK